MERKDERKREEEEEEKQEVEGGGKSGRLLSPASAALRVALAARRYPRGHRFTGEASLEEKLAGTNKYLLTNNRRAKSLATSLPFLGQTQTQAWTVQSLGWMELAGLWK